MDSGCLRHESHVAQQSRRDKLRIQHPSSNQIDDFPNNWENLSVHSVFSSEMLNFGTTSNVLMVGQELGGVQNRLVESSSSSSFANIMSNPISSNFNSSSKVSISDPQWRGIGSHQSYDLMVNQKAVFVGDVMSNNSRASVHYLKPNYNGFQEIPGQDSLYHNSIHDVVVTPPYTHESSALYVDGVNTWSSELGLLTRKNDQELRTNIAIASDSNTQGLSLSLSSNPPSRGSITQFGEGYESEYLQSRSSFLKEPKLVKPNYSNSPPIMPTRPSIISRSSTGKSLNEMMGSTCNFALRNAGPLGPFTGYATILQGSRFLKPAQELLDEFCNATGSKIIRTMEGSAARMCSEGSCLASVDGVNAGDAEVGAKISHNSGFSSAAFYATNDVDVGVPSTFGESYRPEYQQKKAKLLYMQEEVRRKYKQYQQQMQMVASSFESVAGLSAATPYVSLALKTISRNFRGLKHAISDQLKHVTRALGEDLLLPNVAGSCSKGDTSTTKMRYMDQSLQRLKSAGASVSFFEPQQHVWRPQRGLPERAVAILRAWLFEHFLHPYPSDTDKHMLATQTGLSRNQVSNWFINARVRVWKPLVEEIHNLETKSVAETNRSSGNNDGKSAEGTSQHPNREQALNNLCSSSMVNKQLEYSGSSTGSGEQMETEQWSQDKRSRLEFQVPSSMEGSVMNYLPYQRSGIDMGGLGAVSLTLGLRHGVESVQHTQLQPHEDQLRRQYGGQMIHDFVG